MHFAVLQAMRDNTLRDAKVSGSRVLICAMGKCSLNLHWSTVRCLAYVCMVLCEHGCYKKTEPERTPLLRAHSVAVCGCARFPPHCNGPNDL